MPEHSSPNPDFLANRSVSGQLHLTEAEGSGKSQERAEVNAESENIDKDTETEVVTEKLQGVDKCNLGIEKVSEKALSPIPIDEVHEVMSDQEEVSLTPKSAQQSPNGPPDKRSTSKPKVFLKVLDMLMDIRFEALWLMWFG
ncbi:hypothetical protein U1Q18_039519 [Sarracenia purpurea var. burkii]